MLPKNGHCHFGHIDYCGVLIAPFVPADDTDPGLFGINIIGLGNDARGYANGGKYANDIQLFSESPTSFAGTRVLAVPSCCWHKKGTRLGSNAQKLHLAWEGTVHLIELSNISAFRFLHTKRMEIMLTAFWPPALLVQTGPSLGSHPPRLQFAWPLVSRLVKLSPL